MLKIAVQLAIRNLRKHPLFSFVHLSGLAVGIASSFILLVYVERERSADQQFQHADRIVRIGIDCLNMGGFAKSQLQLAPLLQWSCKDIAFATGLDKAHEEVPIRLGPQERAYKDIYPYYIDENFFKVFSYQASAGNIPGKGLATGEIILTESYARKFFGKEDPIGRTLMLGQTLIPCKIVAVVKEDAGRSHLDPQVFLPLSAPIQAQYSDSWNTPALYNYALLKDKGALTGLQDWLNNVQKKITPANASLQFIIQPLTNIYLHSNLKLEIAPGGSLTQMRMLGGIGLFLLLLAIINYINLLTARSSARWKEIGMQKTFGASRIQLIGQLIIESLVCCLFATLWAAVLIQLFLSCSPDTLGMSLATVFTPLHSAWLLAFSLLIGLLAGLYPAFALTTLRPLHAVRTMIAPHYHTPPVIRKTLIFVQCSIAAALLLVSFAIYGQLQYMKSKDKGFHDKGVLLVEHTGGTVDRIQAFQKIIARQPGVISTSFCNRTPADTGIWMATYQSPVEKAPLTLQTFPVDDQYIATLGLHLSQGRNFDRTLITDTNALIINESAAAALGLPDPVGTLLNGSERIIGVVKDFNYTSMKEKIAPLVLRYDPEGTTLAIRFNGEQTASFISWLQMTAQTYWPKASPSVHFLQDDWQRWTTKEIWLSRMISGFTLLGIFLAALGLVGLTLFNLEQRALEIGVRKTLGAGKADIFRLLSKDTFRRTFLATLLALPISWWLVHTWLEGFAYRTSIGLSHFLAAGIILLLLSFAVTGALTLRTLLTNPAKALYRYRK